MTTNYTTYTFEQLCDAYNALMAQRVAAWKANDDDALEAIDAELHQIAVVKNSRPEYKLNVSSEYPVAENITEEEQKLIDSILASNEAAEEATEEQAQEGEPTMTTPFYTHDCQHCQFLGNYIIEEDKDFSGYYDLYWCRQIATPTVIARWSSNVTDYLSGMPMDSIFYKEHPTYPTHEAYRRAKHRGLEVAKLHPTGATMLIPKSS